MGFRKFVAGAAACAVAASLFAVGPTALAAEITTPITHIVDKATTAPVIDGKLNDTLWTTGDPFQTGNPYDYTDASGNDQQWPGISYKFAWDNNNLYIALDMTDHSLYFNPTKVFAEDAGAPATVRNSFDYTHVELRFSPTNNESTFVNGDAQYIFTYQDDGKPCMRVGSYSANDQQTRYQSGSMNGMKLACTQTDHGWILEAALPWSSLAVTNPGAGSLYSFRVFQQVVINGGTTDEDSDKTPSIGLPGTSSWSKFTANVDHMQLSNNPADVAPTTYTLTAPATFTKSGSNYVTTVSVDRNQAAQLTNPKLYVVYTIQVGGKQYQTYQCLDISSGDTTTKDIVVSAGFSKVMAFLVNGNVDWSQGLPNMQSNALNISIPS